MASGDTELLTKTIKELAWLRRHDKHPDRMLTVIERHGELYTAGFKFADSPSEETAAALEGAAIALAAAALRLAGDGCCLFRYHPLQQEAANAG